MPNKDIKITAIQQDDIPRLQAFLLDQLQTLFNKQQAQVVSDNHSS